jgi:ubiquitin-protein ligase
MEIADISELNLAKTTSISFPNGKDNLLNFEITIRPDEGYYQGGTFVFSFQISQVYPHEAPKVKCKTKVYHPNIDLEGNVCLNILREDWNPVLSVNSILYGLQYLFLVILPCPCLPYCTNSFFWLGILPSGCLGLSLQHWFLVHCVCCASCL